MNSPNGPSVIVSSQRITPSSTISVSAGTSRSCVTARTTGSGRPHIPPATAISSAFSGICEPIVAAVYCKAMSVPMHTAIGSLAFHLGALPGKPQMAAEVELIAVRFGPRSCRR